MTIEGQLGTLPQGVVSRVVRDATDSLAECYTRRHQALPFLSGAITLKLRVGSDGAVRYALPIESTLGDRETERCMVERAQALRFTEPCGGEAEVTFPLELEASSDARPATPIPASRLDAALREHRAAVARCTSGVQSATFRVTVYVTPEGRVAASGTSIPSPEAVSAADCITREVNGWRLPSPGSWYARTTLDLH
ncbi:MAG: AgmX/PglI C-terminal domain-containing protein [Deltaproteobacteria bacterium]|nr:AgmX/PglI C-terminal domain-containing protein [Deltaproteobacteria bacterium]